MLSLYLQHGSSRGKKWSCVALIVIIIVAVTMVRQFRTLATLNEFQTSPLEDISTIPIVTPRENIGFVDNLNSNPLPTWMKGLTRSLVAVQLAASKTGHYDRFLKPSWDRLQFYPSTGKVVADLFIACQPNACQKVDKERCTELVLMAKNSTQITWQVLAERSKYEIKCYYAAVPEKGNETYKFAHSLNFLEMEPFLSILKLDFYDYILRTDVDAILFPGLLQVPPTGDGWIGDGFYGMEITNHLVQHFAQKLLPELGPPLRPNEMTPSMQSTFYVHKSKFKKFTSVLLNATKTLHDNAFTEEACREIRQLPIAKQLHPDEDKLCRWPLWHRPVSSLYGTRVAVDHVLDTATVTKSLDAMSSHWYTEQKVNSTIQGHMLTLKQQVALLFNRNDVDLCSRPVTRSTDMKDWREPQRDFFIALEEVESNLTATDNHGIRSYTATIILEQLRKMKKCPNVR